MAKKKLTENDYWAQHIIRAQQDGKDYIFALVRRKYDEDDIETTGPGEYLGLSREERYPKITDKDPDSDTFGKRIDKPNAEPIGIRLIYKDEFNAKNIEKYKAMAGVTGFGETGYIWKFKQINLTADNVNEFWEIPQEEAYDKYIVKQQVVKIEENKSNNRRKNP